MTKAGTAASGDREPKTRRRWTRQEKRQIVEETLVAGASIARVAQAHAVNANQVHRWRRLSERGLLADRGTSSTLLPVRVVPERSAPVVAGSVAPVLRGRVSGVIQVEVERGRLRIEGAADPVALQVVLESLLGC
jgi:transposase